MTLFDEVRPKTRRKGFTIVELLIVIVVIGILASIIIVSYTGIRQKAIASSLQSDLSSAITQIKLYQVINDAYPTNLDCSGGNNPAPPKICLKSSPGNAYSSYLADNTTPQTFCLTIDNSGIDYYITQGTSPAVGSCAVLASGNALASDLLSGKTATTDAGSINGTMTSKVGSGVTITPGTVAQAIPQGYYGGTLVDGKIKGDANLTAANIMSGKSIFGVVGAYGGVTITSRNATATFTQTVYPWGHTWFNETVTVADADKVIGVYVNSTCCGYFGTDVIAMTFTKVSATQINVGFNTATQAANNINVNYVIVAD